MALGAFNESLLQSCSFDAVRAWLAGRQGADSLPAKPRITDIDRLDVDNEDTTSGNALAIASTITTSVVVDVSATALTTGKVLDMSDLSAITTGKALHIDATGVTQTTGILVHIDSASTALTGAGRLFLVDHTGASASSAVVAEIASAAADETTIARITASAALAAGVALDISLAAMTTGTGIDMSNLDAITTGKAIHVDATGVTQTTGILAHIDSASTALTGAGRLLLVDHTGASSSSGTVAEIKSAAADETVIAQILASAALAGKALNISVASMTTGTALSIPDLDALTTGLGVDIISAATAITGAGRLFRVYHSGATSTSGIIAEIVSDATDETNPCQIKGGGTGNLLVLVNTNTGAKGPTIETYHNVGSAASADDDVIMRLLVSFDDEEVSQTKRQGMKFDVQITDATGASFATDVEWYMATGAAENLAVTLSGAGLLSVDADGGGADDPVSLFDDYDDAQLLALRSENALAFYEKMCEIGCFTRKGDRYKGVGSRFMMNLQPTIFLMMGGIYQNRWRMDQYVESLEVEIQSLREEVELLKLAA